jgi:flagellar assembly protein FliH
MAPSPVIPKSKLSAFERWDMGSFDATPKVATVASTAAMAKEIAARSHAEGFEAGRREGLEAGKREAISENAARVARLDTLISAMAGDLARLDAELARDVVELGLTVARKIIGAAVELRPEVVLHAVEEALRHLGRVQGEIHVLVHPEDAAIVEPHLHATAGARTWKLKADATVARGGCRVLTSGSEVDATIAHRWQRITAALGNTQEWVG